MRPFDDHPTRLTAARSSPGTPRAALQSAAQAQGQASLSAPGAVHDGRIPVLMYHRVSKTGANNTARYRLTPEALEGQLAYLRDAGYRSVNADELTQSLESRRPLPGKRVLLTFDDAYVDFADTAWPLLQRYGFGAMLFVVSGCAGKTNEWDHALGEVVPLLGWDALRKLQAAGVTIGAHTVTHPPLTGLSPRDVANEATRSRRMIQRELGTPPLAFAYPYGDRNEAVEQIVGSCGFTLGFTCRSDLLHVHDAPLSLPRIEVEGNDDLATFINKLG